MLRSIQAVVAGLSLLSFMAADTASIGTVSARGDFRLDSHMIKSNATLFNGSVVETGEATADLRMEKGTAIVMSTNSRGTLYGDHLVLEQGKSEFTASKDFHLEVNSLRVLTDESNSQGVVSLAPGNTVQVAALKGAFSVTDDHGIQLARVSPGRAMNFALQASSGSSAFKGTGRISVDMQDGKYYLTLSDTGAKYQLVGGKGLAGLVGKEVVVVGTIQAAASPIGDATAIVNVQKISKLGTIEAAHNAMVAGIIVGSLGATVLVVYETTKTSTPASR